MCNKYKGCRGCGGVQKPHSQRNEASCLLVWYKIGCTDCGWGGFCLLESFELSTQSNFALLGSNTFPLVHGRTSLVSSSENQTVRNNSVKHFKEAFPVMHFTSSVTSLLCDMSSFSSQCCYLVESKSHVFTVYVMNYVQNIIHK